MLPEHLQQTLSSLPDTPGVYCYYNKNQALIYIGKAKNLKKRVMSYFQKAQHDRKTRIMVSEIAAIEYTLCETEFDALLLENNLIKQNHPKYNILLRDDKTFPYICILDERFPRIIATRKHIPKQGEYFGPYAGVGAMNNVLDFVRRMYTVRTCSLLLNEENIRQKKFKVCLEYHLKNCKGPCENLQDEASYAEDIAQARNILKGQLRAVEQFLAAKMEEAAQTLQFEKAHEFKEKIRKLESYHAKSLAVNPRLTDIDVATITSTENEAFVNYMRIKEGSIIFTTNVQVTKKLNEADEEVLALALLDLRETHHSSNPEIFTNIPLPVKSHAFENTVPVIGDKKKLVDLSLKNAFFLKQKKQNEKQERQSKINPALREMQKDLRLSEPPMVIECFDNSNFQGTNPVASMVRFVNGKADKAGYRHFIIKTVVGPDDFASMNEIVTRRYKRLSEEKKEMPGLIMVDGGKGQLSSACEALKSLDLYGKIPIVGIAKRLEEIYYPEDPIPLHLSKKSYSLLLMQQIRDEAHRFAIEFHRNRRSKNSFRSALDEIDGVGKATSKKLLARFKSVSKIKTATTEELQEVVSEKLAKKILETLNQSD